MCSPFSLLICLTHQMTKLVDPVRTFCICKGQQCKKNGSWCWKIGKIFYFILFIEFYFIFIFSSHNNRTEHERASGENRVSKPYPAGPRLPDASFNRPNMIDYDNSISDISSIMLLYNILLFVFLNVEPVCGPLFIHKASSHRWKAILYSWYGPF